VSAKELLHSTLKLTMSSPPANSSGEEKPSNWKNNPDLYEQYQTALHFLSGKNGLDDRKQVSQVFTTDHSYEVHLRLLQFTPSQIQVRAVRNFIIVEGKHEAKTEKVGLISHSFARRYVLPNGVDPADITCTIGEDNILRLKAPRFVGRQEKRETLIPIIHTELVGEEPEEDDEMPHSSAFKKRGNSVETSEESESLSK